jgi:short subunit dehydrogenase-like uncharacterized protein
MENNTFLLYGANGYTGRLIADMAKDYGLRPILAGRNATAIKAQADQLGLDYRVFDLNDQRSLENALLGVPLVLHAAGPFFRTYKKMVQACLATNTHYLDITGEIAVFEGVKRMNDLALQAGLMLMPGVGFDVVPTDCMAAFLKQQQPDATHLKLAFATIGGKLSHGTSMTMAEGLGEGGAARIDGKITKQALGKKGMWVDFGKKKLFTMTIPWGDVSTAFVTTGIPNIETYTTVAPKQFKILKWQFLFNWALRTNLVRNYIKKQIAQKPTGPSAEIRETANSYIWGQVQNAAGEKKTARLVCPEGYKLTAISSLIIAKKVLEGNFKPGYQTPAGLYGSELVLEIPGVSRTLIQD